jgi:AcrR family transcriptional regulator
MVLDRKTADSRRASRRARELAVRRADMLASAAEVFARKGYDGAQMAEIAAAAEVSLASLYAEFRGKDDIYQAVIDDAGGRVLAAIRERAAAVRDPGEALLEVIDAMFECMERDIALLRLVVSGSSGLPWRFRTSRESGLLGEFTDWVTALCRKAVRSGPLRGLDAGALARTLIGAVLHAAAHAVDAKPPARLTDQAPRVRAIFSRLIAGAGR